MPYFLELFKREKIQAVAWILFSFLPRKRRKDHGECEVVSNSAVSVGVGHPLVTLGPARVTVTALTLATGPVLARRPGLIGQLFQRHPSDAEEVRGEHFRLVLEGGSVLRNPVLTQASLHDVQGSQNLVGEVPIVLRLASVLHLLAPLHHRRRLVAIVRDEKDEPEALAPRVDAKDGEREGGGGRRGRRTVPLEAHLLREGVHGFHELEPRLGGLADRLTPSVPRVLFDVALELGEDRRVRLDRGLVEAHPLFPAGDTLQIHHSGTGTHTLLERDGIEVQVTDLLSGQDDLLVVADEQRLEVVTVLVTGPANAERLGERNETAVDQGLPGRSQFHVDRANAPEHHSGVVRVEQTPAVDQHARIARLERSRRLRLARGHEQFRLDERVRIERASVFGHESLNRRRVGELNLGGLLHVGHVDPPIKGI